MKTYEEAYNIVIESAFVLKSEKINFQLSINRILTEDIYSDINMPPFNKSAMDGFACRLQDLYSPLKIIETIPAGKSPEMEITQGKCARIMTGAMVPNGADTVIMVEHTQEIEPGLIKFNQKITNSNICQIGEDIKTNEKVISKGTLLKPAHIAVLATVGCTSVPVYKKPVVGIISTGDEIVEPHNIPEKSKIRNSNAYQLFSQVLNSFSSPEYFGIALDSKEDTRLMISKALNQCDVVLLSGGVSTGDFDFVPEIMEELGVDIKFRSVAVQPGKPTTFGISENNKYIFGLPGNPVSSFTQFELMVKPFLFKLMGHDLKEKKIYLPMEENFLRTKSERKAFIPVCITETGTVKLIDYHGSAHINAYIHADGIISVEIGTLSIKKGELVHVRQL